MDEKIKANNEKVIVNCYKCGADIYVSADIARRHKNKNLPFKCRKCLAVESKERYANLSSEEKQRRAEISKSRMKDYWEKIPNEDKEKRLDVLNKGFQQYSANMTDDDKKHMSKVLSKAQSKRWENMASYKRETILNTLHSASKEWYANLSEEDKTEFHKYIQAGNKQWWESLSEEEKAKYSQIRKDASKKYWDQVKENPDLMKEVKDRASKNLKNYWNNMTDAERKDWNNKRQKGLQEYVNSLQYTGMNNNESSFADYMNKYNISYDIHWFNTKEYPDFDKLFPNNPVTNSNAISPFHQWDFKLHTLSGDVLVDVDGSIHDVKSINHKVKYYNGKIIDLSEMIQFNDSKRPYQTDGLPSYVVLCYNDNLTYDTPVKNICNNEIISFKEFIAILQFMNLSEEDKKEILESAFKK